MQYLFLDVKWV